MLPLKGGFNSIGRTGLEDLSVFVYEPSKQTEYMYIRYKCVLLAWCDVVCGCVEGRPRFCDCYLYLYFDCQ